MDVKYKNENNFMKTILSKQFYEKYGCCKH